MCTISNGMKSVAAIILILTAFAMIFLAARPMWDEILIIRAESAVISDSLARLKEVEALRDQLLDTYNSIPKSDLARLEKFLPSKANTEDILVSVENITRERGIVLKNINFSAIAENSQQLQQATAPAPGQAQLAPASAVSYNFTLSSSYEAFRSVLDAFEKNLRLTDLTSVGFSSAENNVYNFTLQAKSYYQK